MRAVDLTGSRFGRLTATARAPNTSRGQARWLCSCDCGSEKIVRAGHLKSGGVTSCGCYRREFVRSHGHAANGEGRTSEYNSWCAMKGRCYNENHRAFQWYGGKGVTVCDRWRGSFENFLNDMGPKPAPGFTIDRVDSDGDYEPGNCRWLSMSENTRRSRVNGEI